MRNENGSSAAPVRGASVQASVLSAVAGMTEALAQRLDLSHALPDILATLLGATGVSRGALIVREGDEMTVRAQLGLDATALAAIEDPAVRRVMLAPATDLQTPTAFRLDDPRREVRDFLASVRARFVSLVPLWCASGCEGLLVLLSDTRDLSHHDWTVFTHIMGSQIGQSLALARTLAMVRASEERNRTLMRCAGDGIAVLSLDGTILEVNPAVERILGRNGTDLVGRQLVGLVVPEERSSAHRQLTHALETRNGTIGRAHFARGSAAGQEVVIEISVTVVEFGGESTVMTVWHDITEHERARSEMRFLHTLMLEADAAPDLPRMLDLVLCTIGLHLGWGLGTGWLTFDDSSKLACTSVWSRDELDEQVLERLAARVFRSGEGIAGRTLADRASRVVLDVSGEDASLPSVLLAHLTAAMIIPVKVGDEVTAILEIFADTPVQDPEHLLSLATTIGAQLSAVVARRRAESELRERVLIASLAADVGHAVARSGTSKQAIADVGEAIVRSLGGVVAGVWLVDPAREVLGWCGGVQSTLGSCEIALDEPGMSLIIEHGASLLRNDLLVEPPPVDRAWVERERIRAFAGHPIRVGDEVVGMVAVFSREPVTDTTARGLAAIADTIGVGVQRARTQDANATLEAQLRQAQKMEAVGRLAGGIAHDFNNALSVVLSYGDLIAADLPPGDPMRADVEEICKAGQRAATLTRQLLLFSRQQVVEPQVLDLGETVRNLDKMLRRLLGADVELTCHVSEGCGHVRIDPGSVDQVVMNLVVNARDAMPTGGKVTIEIAPVVLDEDFVRLHHGATAGPHVMLAVTDTGIGMDRATVGRIFEPFFTTKERGKGTGLGLSIVFGIVQQGHGTIWVYSEPGHGSTFKLYFPVVDADVKRRTRDSSSPLSGYGDEIVLVVDDEDAVREVARDILRRYGYTVLEARNAGEAILVTETDAHIDLLISDVVMPQMSGPELAKRLARSRPAMKILCMSGYTDDTIVRHGVIDASFAYLQKPFTPETLTRKVREILDSPPAA